MKKCIPRNGTVYINRFSNSENFRTDTTTQKSIIQMYLHNMCTEFANLYNYLNISRYFEQ